MEPRNQELDDSLDQFSRLEWMLGVSDLGKIDSDSHSISSQAVDPFRSYFVLSGGEYDISSHDKRKEGYSDLVRNAIRTPVRKEVDISPLKNDLRVCGIVGGDDPAQNTYDLISEYGNSYKDINFFGFFSQIADSNEYRFNIYVESSEQGEEVAKRLKQIKDQINEDKGKDIPLEVCTMYGNRDFEKYFDTAEVENGGTSLVDDRVGLIKFLKTREVRSINNLYQMLDKKKQDRQNLTSTILTYH